MPVVYLDVPSGLAVDIKKKLVKEVAEFLSIKQQDNASPKYLADLRSKLGRFVNSFHDTLVSNLTAAQIEAWIRSLGRGTVSRESYRRNVSVLLEFGRRRGAFGQIPQRTSKSGGVPRVKCRFLGLTNCVIC